jgi:hypothetical protein
MMALFAATDGGMSGAPMYWLSAGNPVSMLLYLALAIPSVWYWLK